MENKTKEKSGLLAKISGMTDSNLLLTITIVVFILMYIGAMIFLGKGFLKPQAFFNILNENANLADCEYGVFCNFSSSEISVVQRQGRLLRHKNPIIVLPYYADTREEELVKTYIEGFTKVKTIHSILEI